VGTSR